MNNFVIDLNVCKEGRGQLIQTFLFFFSFILFYLLPYFAIFDVTAVSSFHSFLQLLMVSYYSFMNNCILIFGYFYSYIVILGKHNVMISKDRTNVQLWRSILIDINWIQINNYYLCMAWVYNLLVRGFGMSKLVHSFPKTINF